MQSVVLARSRYCSGTIAWWPDGSMLDTRARIVSYVSMAGYCTYTVSYCTGRWRKLSVGSGLWWTMIQSDNMLTCVRMMDIVRSPECLVTTKPHLSINLYFIIVTKL